MKRAVGHKIEILQLKFIEIADSDIWMELRKTAISTLYPRDATAETKSVKKGTMATILVFPSLEIRRFENKYDRDLPCVDIFE